MEILRATHLGMCFGVRDAIALAEEQAARGPVTILGELVHNPVVLRRLSDQGVAIAQSLDQVRTETVIITAHGASDQRIAEVRAKGYRTLEATCPLVAHAHRSLRQLVTAGYHPVVFGKRGHVEVNGLVEDYPSCELVSTEDELRNIPFRPRFGVISQTTMPIDRVRDWVAQLRRIHPTSEVRFVDTVCQPTKQRQSAASELAGSVDVVVVIGGANSNNTRELVETSLRECDRVHHVQSAEMIDPAWFKPEDRVGITAGTSTPDRTIEEVERVLRSIAVGERKIAA